MDRYQPSKNSWSVAAPKVSRVPYDISKEHVRKKKKTNIDTTAPRRAPVRQKRLHPTHTTAQSTRLRFVTSPLSRRRFIVSILLCGGVTRTLSLKKQSCRLQSARCFEAPGESRSLLGIAPFFPREEMEKVKVSGGGGKQSCSVKRLSGPVLSGDQWEIFLPSGLSSSLWIASIPACLLACLKLHHMPLRDNHSHL